MKAVFLDTATFADFVTFSAIKQVCSEYQAFAFTSPEHIIERCIDADIVITNKVVFNASLLAQLPQLQLICVSATGVNNIDIAACQQHNIAVANVKDYAANSVSQHVFAEILSYYHQIEQHHHAVADGTWQHSPSFALHSEKIDEIAGKILSIIGYGSIGRKVANIAKAFDMQVLIAEHKNASQIRQGRTAFNSAIKRADIISLHCPLTEDTRHLFNAETFQLCKPSALLINTARGDLINNKALMAALANEQIAAARLDVLDQEPPSGNHPLIQAQSPRLKITGHIAWASQQAQQGLINEVAENIRAFRQNEQRNRLV